MSLVGAPVHVVLALALLSGCGGTPAFAQQLPGPLPVSASVRLGRRCPDVQRTRFCVDPFSRPGTAIGVWRPRVAIPVADPDGAIESWDNVELADASLVFDGCSVFESPGFLAGAPTSCPYAVGTDSNGAHAGDVQQRLAVFETQDTFGFGGCTGPLRAQRDPATDTLRVTFGPRDVVVYRRVLRDQLADPESAVFEYCDIATLRGVPPWIEEVAVQLASSRARANTTPLERWTLAALSVRAQSTAVLGIQTPRLALLFRELRDVPDQPGQVTEFLRRFRGIAELEWALGHAETSDRMVRHRAGLQ